MGTHLGVPLLRDAQALGSHTAVYNHDTYVYVKITNESNVVMSFVMLIINQHLHLEILIWNFFNRSYRNTEITALQTP